MTTARELAPEAWSEYLEALGRELSSAPISIAVTGPGNALAGPDEPLALQAMDYDSAQDVVEITAVCGRGAVATTVRHAVDHPVRIAVDNQTMLAPLTVTIDGLNGMRIAIGVEREPDDEE